MMCVIFLVVLHPLKRCSTPFDGSNPHGLIVQMPFFDGSDMFRSHFDAQNARYHPRMPHNLPAGWGALPLYRITTKAMRRGSQAAGPGLRPWMGDFLRGKPENPKGK